MFSEYTYSKHAIDLYLNAHCNKLAQLQVTNLPVMLKVGIEQIM